jgi:hypothetical protein
MTRAVLKKAKNIKRNPNVSFVLPFPHHVLSPLPKLYIQFQGKAEIISIDNPEAYRAFQRSIVRRSSMKHSLKLGDSVFIRVIPDKKIFSFEIGANVFQFLIPSQNKNLRNYYVSFPEDLSSDNEDL